MKISIERQVMKDALRQTSGRQFGHAGGADRIACAGNAVTRRGEYRQGFAARPGSIVNANDTPFRPYTGSLESVTAWRDSTNFATIGVEGHAGHSRLGRVYRIPTGVANCAPRNRPSRAGQMSSLADALEVSRNQARHGCNWISSVWRNGRRPEASESPVVVARHREAMGHTNSGSSPLALTNFGSAGATPVRSINPRKTMRARMPCRGWAGGVRSARRII